MERGSDILIAISKPVRGREMATTAIPIDMFDSARLVSAKRTTEDLTSDPSKPKKANVETYYEGYVDGKKYLVPDSNLEAMKDIINLGMRQRKSTRFRHQTSVDVQDILTLERIDQMLAKIRDLKLSMCVDGKSKHGSQITLLTKEENEFESETLSSSLSTVESDVISQSLSSSKSKPESELRPESLSSSKSKAEGEFRSDSQKSSSLESLLSTEKRASSSEHKHKKQKSVLEKEVAGSDDCYLRLILSGHFKNNEKPVYIVQEYNTKSNLFSKQSADFTSSQTQGNVHIYMAGKLFRENILEETDGKPTSLNLKPNKIIIDERKCKIFRGYFESTYRRKATDITIKGEFLQNERSMDITPFLSLSIKHKNMNMYIMTDVNNEKKSEERRPSILVKNRQSITSNSTETYKDIKRVSFKESSDEEELLVIYKNKTKEKPDDYAPTQVNYTKRDGLNRLNKNQKSGEHKQIIAKRDVFERILYLFTENSLFKKFFSKRK